MSTLPADTLAQVADFLLSWNDRRDVLALRAASTLCRDAVVQAVQTAGPRTFRLNKDAIDEIKLPVARNHLVGPADPTTEPRAIAARGRVFGPACRKLTFSGASTEALAAIRSLVLDTKGSLTALDVSCSSLSVEGFLDICRACPRLKRLEFGFDVPHLWSAMEYHATLEYYATSLSSACPLLEELRLCPLGELLESSPAELYEMHFENLIELKFSNWNENDDEDKYLPSNLDNIERSAQNCLRATSWKFINCIVTQPLVTRLLGTPLCSRVHGLEFSCSQVSPSLVLQLAAGCPLLRELNLTRVDGLDTPAFFEALSNDRPELKQLYVDLTDNSALVNDACLRYIGRLGLDYLMGSSFGFSGARFTAAGVDAIVSGNMAQTLTSLRTITSIDTSDFLRLVQECPKLANVDTRYMYNGGTRGDSVRVSDLMWDENVGRAEALLESRRPARLP